jgi:hypothetical protein
MREPKPGAPPARIRAAFRWVTATESFGDDDEPRAGDGAPSRRRLQFAIALGIVVVSVSSAVAGWRAELFNEYAAQSEGLFRQQLVTLQQRERVYEEQVTSDLRQFGTYEQEISFGQQLQQEANSSTGSLAARLAVAAQGENTLAALNQNQNFFALEPSPLGGAATYAPASAYLRASEGAGALEEFDPAGLRREARTDRTNAVNMTGIAVLFVTALVLLTLGQVTLGGPRVAGRGGWTLGHTLASLAVTVWVAGAVLFTVMLL